MRTNPEATPSLLTLPNVVVGLGVVLFTFGMIDVARSGDMHWLSFGILFVAGGLSWKKGWVL